jgi:hypothetical protein
MSLTRNDVYCVAGFVALSAEVHFLAILPIAFGRIAVFLRELSDYKRLAELEKAKNIEQQRSHWMFWKGMEVELPELWKVACHVCLISPSSASVERVFSLLTNGFNNTQDRALEDYKETSIMLKFNSNWDRRPQI